MMAMDAATPVMTIVYDNETLKEEFTPDWGFSCFIQGTDKKILFDTGTKGTILLSNMAALGIDPKDIDVVVLSHNHGDHTGGLEELLRATDGIVVFAPACFPDDFGKMVVSMGGEYTEVNGSVEICKDVFLTGELGTAIKEQSLSIKTPKGLVIITGCAHPGIVHIVETATKQLEEAPYMVFGGFHLLSHAPEDIAGIVRRFRELSVQQAGPCHCSREDTRALFTEEYGDDYIRIGVGRVISVE